jgi:hypothetical protein
MLLSEHQSFFVYTYIHTTNASSPKRQQRHHRHSSETPTLSQNHLAMSNTADVTSGKPIYIYIFPMSSSYPYPTKWGRYNMFFFSHHIVIKIRQLFLQPAASLTSTILETGAGANDCKCNQDQRLNVPSEARRSSR